MEDTFIGFVFILCRVELQVRAFYIVQWTIGSSVFDRAMTERLVCLRLCFCCISGERQVIYQQTASFEMTSRFAPRLRRLMGERLSFLPVQAEQSSPQPNLSLVVVLVR